MTTIAFKDGVLAADSRSSAGNVITGTREKVMRLPDGSYYAGCGCTADNVKMVDWLSKPVESRGDFPKVEDDYAAFVVAPDAKHPTRWDSCGFPFVIEAPFHATGSGEQFALGAMAMGASASEAVEVACRLDAGTGMSVVSRSVGRIKPGGSPPGTSSVGRPRPVTRAVKPWLPRVVAAARGFFKA